MKIFASLFKVQYRIYPDKTNEWYVEIKSWPFFWRRLSGYLHTREVAEIWLSNYLKDKKDLKDLQEKNTPPIKIEDFE